MATLTCTTCGSSNPEGARFCANCGTALPTERPIEGERRFATVLFADVVRSTAIAEQLDPEDWAQIMNGAFGFMNATISRYEGTVSRLMGDAILALFGAPVSHEDDAARAVRAALEIREKAAEYAEGVKRRYGVEFLLRIGINTGTAVLAFVGDAIRTEYTALGDAANVAARLQSAADPGTVLISADTWRLVHSLFDFKRRGPIEMKGKQAPVESYEVVGVSASPGPTRGIEGLASPLVGRDHEMATLSARLDDLVRGSGSVVALVGEAGLGKSRLMAELRRRVEDIVEPKPNWREARCISYGQSIPYYPWRELGRQIVGASEMDGALVVRDRIAAWVAQLGLRKEDVAFYETMLAVESEISRAALASLDGNAVVQGVGTAVINALKAEMHLEGATRPRVLVLDDLHWGDSASLELLAQVATLAAFEPLMLVCLLRPDRTAPSWSLLDRLQASLGDSFTRIDLEPLDEAFASELLGNLLHIADLPDHIRAQILERSEGNPFYLEEVLRSLIDDGHVVRDGEHWRATGDIVEAKIPETLAGILSARIDRLPDSTKRVAQTASVIGRIFQHRVLEQVCRAGPPQERIEHVEPHLATLSYEQLVRERTRNPEREYIFKHALTCEAAYGLLLKSRRRELHARAGTALETLFADRGNEFAGMLAHHFAEANDLERAVRYSTQAAANARSLYAAREELEHRQNILSFYDKTPDAAPEKVIDAILDWALARHRMQLDDEVIDRLRQAETLARDSGDRYRLGMTLSWIANMHMISGFPSRSVPYLLETQAIAKELGNEQILLLPLFFGTWNLVDKDPAAAVGKLDEVIPLIRKHRIVDVLGHALAYRAVALARLGDFAAAREQVGEALDEIPHTTSQVKRADIHIALGMAYQDMGRLEDSLEQAQLGADLATAAAGLECACAGHFGVGRVQLERRQYEGALEEFNKSLELANASGYDGFINIITGGIAAAEFERKPDPEHAERLIKAVRNASSLNDPYAVAVLSQQLADILKRLHRIPEAEEAIKGPIGYFRTAGMRPYLARAQFLAAEIYALAGKPEEARTARAEAEQVQASIADRPDEVNNQRQAVGS